jgi:ACS family hexuronate transporter-like MFS transporter
MNGARRSPIKNLRWYIGGLLFLSTVINYIDRQTLSVLAPYIKTEFAWSNADFAWLIISFRIAYSFGQTISGRMLDRLGTRNGLTFGVAFYSIAAMATSLATGFRGLVFFRFLLGAGESANWPGATKAVSEWFPRRESGWAVALFDSGSSIGGALAPFIVLWAYHTFGSWRPAFIITGVLGFAWLLLFRKWYHRPEDHPRLSDEERAMILAGRTGGGMAVAQAAAVAGTDASSGQAGAVQRRGAASAAGDGAGVGADAIRDASAGRLDYRTLLSLPQTWGIIIGKALTDPVWYFITDWFAIYLVSKGYRLEESLLAFWVPFLAADLGNFAGGGCSSWLIQRGWSVGAARKLVVLISGLGMTLLIPTVFINSYAGLVACFAVSTFAYAALSTMVLNLPADLYPTESVATVSGLSGTGAGIGTIAATLLIGQVSDRMSFEPILVAASLIPILATIAVLTLVRNTAAMDRGVLNRI